MYLFEIPQESPVDFWPERCYLLQAEGDEQEDFHDAIRLATLGAIAAGEIELEDGAKLINEVTRGLGRSFFASTGPTLEKVIASVQDADEETADAPDRLRSLEHCYIKHASEGALTSAALAEQLRAIQRARWHLSNGSAYVQYISAEGHNSIMTITGMRPQVFHVTDNYLEDKCGAHPSEMVLAEALQATHFVDTLQVQKEYRDFPRVETSYTHTTLGKLDETGEFEPMATVLDKEHPVRRDLSA